MGAGPILALVIEFYLPPSASETEVAQTAEQAYRPLLHLLEDHRERAALTFAVDPALARRLVAARQSGILHGLASLVEGGSAEFAAGTRSHALLPRIPRAEVVRQIQLGDELMRELFGDAWSPQGLFPPALAYGRQVAETAAARRLRWLVLDEISLGRIGAAPTRAVHVANLDRELAFFFRSRDLSAAFLCTTPRALARQLDAALDGGYGVAVVPAEKLRPQTQAMKNLEWLFGEGGPVPATLTSLLALFPERVPVEPLPASRRTTPEDLAMGIPFAAWSAPDNDVQGLLWHLAALAWTEAARLCEERPDAPETRRLRAVLDAGLHSAPFRQASHGPAFRPEAVLEAGRTLYEAVEGAGALVPDSVRRQAREAHRRLVGAVDSRTPFR